MESYTPRTWRTHPLHLCPSDTHDLSDPMNKSVLDWIFLISSLNFSFWSEREGRPDRYGVEWRCGWGSDEKKVWTGYSSLVASLNRGDFFHQRLFLTASSVLISVLLLLLLLLFPLALEEEIPITDPRFYSSETLCPDSLIEHVFRATNQSNEPIPLLRERIAIMREVGYILCNVSSHPHTDLCPLYAEYISLYYRAMAVLSKAFWMSFNDNTMTKAHPLT